jgi:uncharacterized SAM-binding protein YcdF (DUF218 family)
MFFALSKIFAFLIKPLNWVLLLAVAAWLVRPTTRRLKLLAWSTALLLVFSNPWLVNQAARHWEEGRLSPDALQRQYDAGIVLGGYLDMNADAPAGLVSLNRAGGRLLTAVQLYHAGHIRHILLTGGAGRLVGTVEPEAPAVARLLRQLGVPDSVILIEDQSRNTRENALLSKALLDNRLPGAKCLLISSSWHLPRAVACFRKVEVDCTPFGTDFITEHSTGNPWRWLEPDWQALLRWELLIKEWIGWVVYRVQGYI